MVDEALDTQSRAAICSRAPGAADRRRAQRRTCRRRSLLRRGGQPPRRARRQRRSTSPRDDATRRPRRGRRSSRRRPQTACACAPARCTRASSGRSPSRPADRTVKVPRRTRSQPKVTTDELARSTPTVILVNRTAFQLTLYKNLKLIKTYGIAVGQVGLETPAGLYHIQNKAVNPAWHVPNSAWAGSLAGQVIPAGRRRTRSRRAGWASTTARASTAPSDDGSIGTAASHGCIRMHIPDVDRAVRPVPSARRSTSPDSAGLRPRYWLGSDADRVPTRLWQPASPPIADGTSSSPAAGRRGGRRGEARACR